MGEVWPGLAGRGFGVLARDFLAVVAFDGESQSGVGWDSVNQAVGCLPQVGAVGESVDVLVVFVA